MKTHLIHSLCLSAALVAALTGCTAIRPLKPGIAKILSTAPSTGAAFASELKQPENPAQAAAQTFERTTETETPLPQGTRIVQTVITRDEAKPAAPPMVTEKTIVLAEPVVQRTRTVEKAGTTVGAAQKDTARELSTKLASLKGVVWIGLGLFLFGLASLVYPPLRAVIGSVTTSVAMIAGGIALMALPTLVVGNELLILGGVVTAVGGWFLAHRHGELRGKIQAGG